MAEETGSTSVQTTATAAAEAPSIVVPDGPITTLEEKRDIVDTRESLFGDEKRLTEAELTGEEAAEEKPAEPGTKDAVTSPPAGEPGKEPAKTPEQEAAAKATEDAEKDSVVKATEGIRRELTEERAQRRTVSQQLDEAHQVINELRAALENGPSAEAQASPLDKFKDFKELTDDEFKELVASDYAEAQVYLKDLADYREAKRADTDMQRQRNAAKTATQRQIATVINTSREAMAKEVPGLFDENSDVNDKLMAFAESNGMDVDLLVALTDPGTFVVERGAKAGKYVGGGAVAALRFLNNLYQAETKMEARLREEITNELVTKFKIDAGVFRSLGDTPSTTTTPDDTGQLITEDQMRNMSEDDKRKALGG